MASESACDLGNEFRIYSGSRCFFGYASLLRVDSNAMWIHKSSHDGNILLPVLGTTKREKVVHREKIPRISPMVLFNAGCISRCALAESYRTGTPRSCGGAGLSNEALP